MSVFAYDEVKSIHAMLQAKHWPIVSAFIATFPASERAELEAHANSVFEPVLHYFEDRFVGRDGRTGIMETEMTRFRFARFAAPQYVGAHHGTFPAVLNSPEGQKLQLVMPYVTPPVFDALRAELPIYVMEAPSFDTTTTPGAKKGDLWKEVSDKMLAWWKSKQTTLPHWSTFARRVFLIQPSSAAVERVFSILNDIYTKERYSSLNDVIELSCMYKYNTRS